MAKKPKFYVVWVGRKTGIYKSWDDCKAQTDGFLAAKYKSFETMHEAEKAWSQDFAMHIGSQKIEPKLVKATNQKMESNAICVDAACSGNPGRLEYRGVDCDSGEEIFRQGPFESGTNNIGEFLALAHGIGYLQRRGERRTIYSDSRTALAWVRNKKAKTNLVTNKKNEYLFELIDRAECFLKTIQISDYNLVKWPTESWGEIPADFGRK